MYSMYRVHIQYRYNYRFNVLNYLEYSTHFGYEVQTWSRDTFTTIITSLFLLPCFNQQPAETTVSAGEKVAYT